jgi:hypothetical protein
MLSPIIIGPDWTWETRALAAEETSAAACKYSAELKVMLETMTGLRVDRIFAAEAELATLKSNLWRDSGKDRERHHVCVSQMEGLELLDKHRSDMWRASQHATAAASEWYPPDLEAHLSKLSLLAREYKEMMDDIEAVRMRCWRDIETVRLVQQEAHDDKYRDENRAFDEQMELDAKSDDWTQEVLHWAIVAARYGLGDVSISPLTSAESGPLMPAYVSKHLYAARSQQPQQSSSSSAAAAAAPEPPEETAEPAEPAAPAQSQQPQQSSSSSAAAAAAPEPPEETAEPAEPAAPAVLLSGVVSAAAAAWPPTAAPAGTASTRAKSSNKMRTVPPRPP